MWKSVGPPSKFQRRVADFVDQVVVVGDEQDRALVALQGDVERVDGFEVEVVGGLVEDQDVGLGEHELAEEQAGRFAAGERFGRLAAFFAAEEHLAEDAADVFDMVACGSKRCSHSATVVPLADGAWSRPGGSSRSALRGPMTRCRSRGRSRCRRGRDNWPAGS